jgi:hypothetical protein
MEDEAGFLNIEVSSDEAVDDVEKVRRDFQSEEDFQKQRREWKPKIEVGEVSLYRTPNMISQRLKIRRSGRR